MEEIKTTDHTVTTHEIKEMMDELSDRQYEQEIRLTKQFSDLDSRLTKQQWDIYGKMIPLIITVQAGIIGLLKLIE